VTAEHPFLTAEGWKALDPDATRRESPSLAVVSLQLGDRLCRGMARVLSGERRSMPGAPGVLFIQSSEVLETLSATAADPNTPLFNLLLDGDHSYVADGWIVHNKGDKAGSRSDDGAGKGSSSGDAGEDGGHDAPGGDPAT